VRLSLSAAALWMAGPVRPLIEPSALTRITSRFTKHGYDVMRIDAYGHLLSLLAADQTGALHEFWVDTESRDPEADYVPQRPGIAIGFLVVALLVEVVLVAALVAVLGLPLP